MHVRNIIRRLLEYIRLVNRTPNRTISTPATNARSQPDRNMRVYSRQQHEEIHNLGDIPEFESVRVSGISIDLSNSVSISAMSATVPDLAIYKTGDIVVSGKLFMKESKIAMRIINYINRVKDLQNQESYGTIVDDNDNGITSMSLVKSMDTDDE